jgi:hypothetical protein
VSQPLAFRAQGNRGLRRAGWGRRPVRVSLDGGWLDIAEEHGPGTPLRLPVAAIERMRIGFVDARGGPFYLTTLWPAGDKPIKLAPLREDRLPYAAFARALAGQVAASRGLRAVERGDTWFGALLGPVLMGLVVVAALAVSIHALADEETLLRWVPAVIPALVFALLLSRYHAVHRPRPLADLAELDRQLPR